VHNWLHGTARAAVESRAQKTGKVGWCQQRRSLSLCVTLPSLQCESERERVFVCVCGSERATRAHTHAHTQTHTHKRCTLAHCIAYCTDNITRPHSALAHTHTHTHTHTLTRIFAGIFSMLNASFALARVQSPHHAAAQTLVCPPPAAERIPQWHSEVNSRISGRSLARSRPRSSFSHRLPSLCRKPAEKLSLRRSCWLTMALRYVAVQVLYISLMCSCFWRENACV